MSDDRPVVMYAVGIVAMSVCAKDDVSRETIETWANFEHPTGIQSRWEVSVDATFATGEPHPTPCEHATGRTHYLLNC